MNRNKKIFANMIFQMLTSLSFNRYPLLNVPKCDDCKFCKQYKFDKHSMARMSMITSIYFVRKAIEIQHLMILARVIHSCFDVHNASCSIFWNLECRRFPWGHLMKQNLCTMSVKRYLQQVIIFYLSARNNVLP